MALRKEIDHYSFNGYEASVQYDGGMEPGGEHYVVISENDERLIHRTFYFDTFDRTHARNFVQKFARDANYRRRCMDGEETWVKIQEAYEEHNTDVFSVYEPLGTPEWGQAYDEAKKQAMKHCQSLFHRLSDLFGEVDDPTASTVQAVVDTVREEAEDGAEALREKYAPAPTDHTIQFGKYEGKTLLEIAGEDPDYAEWAAEEMDNRPKIQGGFEKALLEVGKMTS